MFAYLAQLQGHVGALRLLHVKRHWTDHRLLEAARGDGDRIRTDAHGADDPLARGVALHVVVEVSRGVHRVDGGIGDDGPGRIDNSSFQRSRVALGEEGGNWRCEQSQTGEASPTGKDEHRKSLLKCSSFGAIPGSHSFLQENAAFYNHWRRLRLCETGLIDKLA